MKKKQKKIRKKIKRRIKKMRKKIESLVRKKAKLKGMVYFNRSLRLSKILKRNKGLKVLNMLHLEAKKEKDKLKKSKEN